MKKILTAIKSVLLIDPSDRKNTNLISVFEENGLVLEIISNEHNYQNRIHDRQYDCVMLNSDLENDKTENIIDFVKTTYPGIIVVILLEEPTFEKIFRLVRLGVDDFIIKPYIWDDIEKLLRYYYY